MGRRGLWIKSKRSQRIGTTNLLVVFAVFFLQLRVCLKVIASAHSTQSQSRLANELTMLQFAYKQKQ